MLMQLRGRVQAGRWEEFLAFLGEAIPFYEEPGGIRVRLLRSSQDPDAFLEVVEYESRASYEQDQLRAESDAAMLGYLARWRELLAGSVQVETYEDVTPRRGR